MKLRTQISEYDCAPTTYLNAFSCLFKRDEIAPGIIRIIYKNSLDCKENMIGDCGTSKRAMKKITKKIKQYSLRHNINLDIKYIKGNKVDICKIINWIKHEGIIIVRSYLELEHYFLITDIDDNSFFIFDPYLNNTNELHNTKVLFTDMDSEAKTDYSLGPVNKREIILLKKT